MGGFLLDVMHADSLVSGTIGITFAMVGNGVSARTVGRLYATLHAFMFGGCLSAVALEIAFPWDGASRKCVIKNRLAEKREKCEL